MKLVAPQLSLLLLLITHFSFSFAGEVDDPFCNARRVFGGAEKIAQMNPGFEGNCYVFVRKLIRKATGHDINIVEAEGVLETLFVLSPESAYPHIGLAELEIKKRELELTGKPMHQIYWEAKLATQIKPLVADAFVTFGRVNLLMNCLFCAESAAGKASELDASSPDLALLLSSIDEERNNIADASAVLSKALSSHSSRLTPEVRIDMHLRLSLLNAIAQNYVAAEDELGKAIDIDPENHVPYLARAKLLFFIGDAEAATKAAKASSRVKPTVSAKKVQSFAEYLSWAKAYFAGDRSIDIKRVAQTSFVSPEEAFVESARYGAISIITEALLQEKVIKNIDEKDGQGNTALMAACLGNNIQLMTILLDQNANPDTQNSRGERALSYLVSNGNYDATLVMLNSNAEVNFTDINGNSPLSLAVFRNDKLLVGELLAHGASLQPVIDLAKQMGITEIEKIIASLIPSSI